MNIIKLYMVELLLINYKIYSKNLFKIKLK